jgi:hypothetical protein
MDEERDEEKESQDLIAGKPYDIGFVRSKMKVDSCKELIKLNIVITESPPRI